MKKSEHMVCKLPKTLVRILLIFILIFTITITILGALTNRTLSVKLYFEFLIGEKDEITAEYLDIDHRKCLYFLTKMAIEPGLVSKTVPIIPYTTSYDSAAKKTPGCTKEIVEDLENSFGRYNARLENTEKGISVHITDSYDMVNEERLVYIDIYKQMTSSERLFKSICNESIASLNLLAGISPPVFIQNLCHGNNLPNDAGHLGMAYRPDHKRVVDIRLSPEK